MRVVRTPLRICLAGGSTDIPEFFRKYGGFVVSATIDKYITVKSPYDIWFWYDAEIERYVSASGFKGSSLCIDSLVKSGSGLGGSSAFLVAMLKLQNPEMRDSELAQAAYAIERYTLGKPVGYQDAYAAAYGGMVTLMIEKDGCCKVCKQNVPEELQDWIVMFSTGIQRSASEVLEKQQKAIASSQDSGRAMFEIKKIGLLSSVAIEQKDWVELGLLTKRHWEAKKTTCGATTTPEIDQWYEIAMKAGAIGGKNIGAGAGGYMMFYAHPQDKGNLIDIMQQNGLKHSPFKFVNKGVEIVQ